MSRFVQRIKRIPDLFTHGLLLYHALEFLGSKGMLFRPFYLFQEGLFDPNMAEELALPEGYELVELQPSDLAELDRIDHRGYTAQDLLQRLQQGHLGLALKCEDKVAAFTWCNFDEIHHDMCGHALGPREAYLYDAHTRPAYRGARLAPRLRYQCYLALKARGRDVLYSSSDYFNKSALIFKQKLHARVLYLALHVELFGRYKRTWILRRKAEVAEPGAS